MKFVYGMRLRGFSPGCQPMNGLMSAEDSEKRKTGFHSILTYSRKLTAEEREEYELTEIKQEEEQ